MDKFKGWSKERGIKTEAIIKKTLYAGYGLFSLQNIDKDSETTIVHIPKNTLLTSHNALNVDSDFASSIYDFLSQKDNNQNSRILAEKKENEKLVLCLFLIYCNFFKSCTIWKPYIDILPTIDYFKENHVLFQTDCVAGTNLDNSVSAKLSSLRKELDEITQQESWLSNITFDMYIWSDCIFWSRVVGIGGDVNENQSDMALIPYFDFANHSINDANIRWQRNKENQGIDLVSYPEKSIYKDRELLLSYGSKSNQELLFLHGFCIENNPELSRLTIPLLPFLNPANGEYNMQKIIWLRNIGAKPILTFINGWTFNSTSIMYLVALDEDDGIEFDVDEESGIISLILSGVKINSLKELNDGVQKLKVYKIIQLRVAYLLLEALEYHYTLNIENHQSNENQSLLWKQASIYRLEEQNSLKQAIQLMTDMRDKLMQDEFVVSYLG